MDFIATSSDDSSSTTTSSSSSYTSESELLEEGEIPVTPARPTARKSVPVRHFGVATLNRAVHNDSDVRADFREALERAIQRALEQHGARITMEFNVSAVAHTAAQELHASDPSNASEHDTESDWSASEDPRPPGRGCGWLLSRSRAVVRIS